MQPLARLPPARFDIVRRDLPDPDLDAGIDLPRLLMAEEVGRWKNRLRHMCGKHGGNTKHCLINNKRRERGVEQLQKGATIHHASGA